MTLIEPLDIQTLFVDLWSGTNFIFTVIFGIFVGFYGARFRMPTVIILLCFGLLAVIMTPLDIWLYYVILISGGLFIGFQINRLVK